MTDEQGTSEGFPSPIQPWIVRLRRITEELAGMTRLSESLFTQPLGSLTRTIEPNHTARV